MVGCWAHTRRKFDEALNALPPGKREEAATLTGLEYCNKLFTWERQLEKLSREERTDWRLKEGKPILDALFTWADFVSAAPKSVLGRVLSYLKDQQHSCGIWRMDGWS
ncbi:MAG: transposase [Clostridiales bacterium]|nr:transposase [Clostridiales bacterium]